MNHPADLESTVSAWLHAEATARGSDRVLAAALARVPTVHQRRSWPMGALAPLGRYAKQATVTAIVVALGAVIGASIIPARPDVTGGVAASSPSPGPAIVDRPETHMIRVPLLGATLWFMPPRPAGTWEVELKDDLYISSSVVGPQGAEAMILFTTIPATDDFRPCLLPPGASSIDELAGSMATAPGTELVAGPSPTRIGDRRALHVAVNVKPLWDESGMPQDPDVGCDPGFFFAWEAFAGGAMWPGTVPGDRIHAWIVDVGGTPVIVQSIMSGRVTGGIAERLHGQIQGVVGSIRFEQP